VENTTNMILEQWWVLPFRQLFVNLVMEEVEKRAL